MKYSCLFFLCLLSFAMPVAAQMNDGTDEFEIQDVPFEINPSKESVKPESDPEPAPDIVEIPTQPIQQQPIQQEEEDTVLVRTREPIEDKTEVNESGLVEVRQLADIFAPYKQRQNKWGFIFSAGYEKLKFPNLESALDGKSFKEIIKDGLTFYNIDLGPKYNFNFGSIAATFGYGRATAENKSPTMLTTINYERMTATATYYMDGLFKEPYVVPYAGFGAWQATYKEQSDYLERSDTYHTKIGTQYKVGLLFGLDWIEEDSSRKARRTTGLQGSYLNVYMISTSMGESADYINLENDMDIGASLVVEF